MQSILEKDGVFDVISNGAKVVNTKLKKRADDINKGSVYLGGSISNYTKDLILTFPTMCDNSLPIGTVGMISKAHERNIVTMLEMLFASKTLEGKDGVEILKKLHKNINTNSSIDDVIDALNTIKAYESFTMKEKAIIREAANCLTESLKAKQKSYPVSSFNERSLNNYLVYNSYGKSIVREADIAKNPSTYRYNADDDKFADDNERERMRKDSQEYRAQRQEDRERAKEERDQAKDERERAKNDRDIAKDSISLQSMRYDMLSKQLVDQDVKKANELTPSLMVIRYNVMDDNNAVTCQNAFVAGVKSRLISVDATDIMDRLAAKNKTKISFLNFIRATTGEIKFVSDFLLSMKQAKLNAKNAAKKGQSAMMWNVLEKRSQKNSFNKARKAGNDASSITTLVVNQETVNMLKKVYDFDLENIKNTKYIMDQFNLLSIIICDESVEVAKFFYDGNDSYESQPYSFLEREGKDSSYKKVINLLNTSGR